VKHSSPFRYFIAQNRAERNIHLSNVSGSLVKTGGEVGKAMAFIIVLPAAIMVALFAGEWGVKAQSVLAAAAASGQAFGEAVVQEVPALARLLAAGDTDAAAGVMLKLWKVLKGGDDQRQNTMLPE